MRNRPFPNNLKNTRRALAWYDKPLRKTSREALLDAANDNKSIEAYFEQAAKDLLVVQNAFYEDTKEINCKDNCMLLSINALREMCKKVEKELTTR